MNGLVSINFVYFLWFKSAFSGVKVWCKAQKIGVWHKTVYVIDPCTFFAMVPLLVFSFLELENQFQIC